MCVCVGGGGGGGTLIFAYIRRLGQFFKILNFKIIGGRGGGVQKNEYFWGYEDFLNNLFG